MTVRGAQRRTYKASQLLLDVNAARRGRLAQRLVRRAYHRRVVGLLRRGRAW